MSNAEHKAALGHAAYELQRYLSDEIAPMTAAEVVEDLLPSSPEIAARVISDWVGSQIAGPTGSFQPSDLVFHALRKLYLLVEYKLLPADAMLRYIQGASRALIQACPPEERDGLRLRLSRLGETETILTSRAEFLHREADLEAEAEAARKTDDATKKTGDADPAPDPKTIDRGARALSLLLERMANIRIPENAKLAENPDLAPLAQLLATAALESKSETDLSRHLERVRGTGIAAPMGQVFRALGWSLPGWTALDEKGELLAAPAGRSLEAMNRIVALAPDPLERAKRWGEMIYAAIEQLNEGRLAQAVSILEAAKRLIAEKRPDPTIVGQVLSQAEGAVAEQVLRKLVESPGKHSLLRLVLEFFPGLRADALLTALDGEKRRDQRKLALALLECHGTACRNLVVDRLASSMLGERPDEFGYYRRNLAFLLRRIPRRGHERLEEEMRLLEGMIARGQPVLSAKEAIGALGQLREVSAERSLVDRLLELESELVVKGGDQESWELLDRLCAAIARQGTQRAIRAVAAHAFKRHASCGDSMARFEHLGWVDLSVDPEQLNALLAAIRERLPGKVLGLALKRPSPELAPLIQAVSGTPTQEVRTLLEALAAKFGNHPLGEQATRALAKIEPKAKTPAPAEALTGDLELFGLPNLIQSLQGSQSSGELVLFDRQQARQGSIGFAQGMLTRCEAGRLTGPEAAYLLFEKPVSGTFSFRAAAGTPSTEPAMTLDPMQIILEGARRHDEYKQARAIAPDGLRLQPVGIPALRPEDETDGDFAGKVWDRAAKGLTPEACEHEMPTDPFRVRRLYAFWIEQGALAARTETTPA